MNRQPRGVVTAVWPAAALAGLTAALWGAMTLRQQFLWQSMDHEGSVARVTGTGVSAAGVPPPPGPWDTLSSAASQALTLASVMAVATALVVVGRPRVALGGVVILAMGPAVTGGALVYSPLIDSPNDLRPGVLPTLGDATVQAIVLVLPVALAWLRLHRSPYRRLRSRGVPAQPHVTAWAVVVGVGLAVTVRADALIHDRSEQALRALGVATVEIVAVVAVTTLLIAACRRTGTATLLLTLGAAAPILVTLGTWELSQHEVNRVGVVALGPVLLGVVPRVAMGWVSAFRRGPTLRSGSGVLHLS